jgi:hypothetical protein
LSGRGSQPTDSLVAALVAEEKSADNGGAFLRFVRCDTLGADARFVGANGDSPAEALYSRIARPSESLAAERAGRQVVAVSRISMSVALDRTVVRTVADRRGRGADRARA